MSERKKTVLIADDESSLRLLVRATITSKRYQVIDVADGLEAWALSRAGYEGSANEMPTVIRYWPA